MSEDLVYLESNGIKIQIAIDSMMYNVIWMRKIADNYYDVSLRNIKHGGCAIYLCFVKDEKIIPIHNSCGLSENEFKIVKLLKSLSVDRKTIDDKILSERISKHKCQLIEQSSQ